MEKQKAIKPFLDEQGLVKVWPGKWAKQLAVLEYLVQNFEQNRDYAEKEVNEIIAEKHTFGDFHMLRRALIDAGLLCRTNNGSRYWRENAE